MIAADVMNRNVISLTPDATVEDAAKLMLAYTIAGLSWLMEQALWPVS